LSAAHHLARGSRLLAANELRTARAEFDYALKLDPHDARAHFLAGEVAGRLQHPGDALRHFEAAIAADPSMVEARAAAGRIYLYAGMAAKALDVAEQGLKLAPDEPQLLAVRAAARGENGDLDCALRDAAAAARAQPDNEVIVGLQSTLYRRAGQSDQAITTASRAVERAPWSIPLRYVLVEALTSGKRVAEAKAELQEIIANEPRVAAHRLRLVQFLATQRDAAGAEQALRDGVAATADDTLKLDLVQLVAQRRGVGAARAEMYRLLNAEPDNDNL
jgi:predicted Zn-dependent protease